ncbi:hypothetical protein AMATHDRAFT_153861 [Amanita thiersii Skay4041]|uniref:Major facilitator superfamily (MFS) profile domain-containing protein n=1 Tax=Amanita thiersii Skay4041 TaxID=703135 RepID=A0A2A9N9Q2_9AGAR|nr:hypothetical protein AMATHDRAFT_153861 [Amanita thiersii Skay4041]
MTITEETTLLSRTRNKKKRTPLPKFQLALLLILHFCEPITSQSIYPYINQLISELDITGGDERKVGYYAGLIESLFFATEAMTVFFWSSASDHVGRKPILLLGLIGNGLSMLFFGLSRTFWMLVLSRCLCGLLNGNIGVMKCVIGEITDSTNRAEGLAFLPVIWALGTTVGPLVGGSLSRPQERFPKVFGNRFWKEYPYFLPCVATASFVLVMSIVTMVFLKETNPKQPVQKSSSTLEISKSSDPVPIRELLVYPVLISVSNYAAIAFLEINLVALIPLFMAIPQSIGGMGASPAVIGIVLGSYGAFLGISQILFFAKIVRRFGERSMFITAMSMYPIIFVLFPTLSMISKNHGPTWLVWTLLIIMHLLMGIMDMGFGCILIYVTAASPNKRSLGATNGLSQTTVSIARAVGPAMATSLLSLSIEKDLLGGYAVYAILFVCSCLALPLATRLPRKVWEEKE